MSASIAEPSAAQNQVRATHTDERRRDGRLGLRPVATRTTTSRVERLPRTCQTLRVNLDETREHTMLAEHVLQEGLEHTTIDAMPLAA